MLTTQLFIRDHDVETSAFPRWELLLLDDHHPNHPSRSILQLEWSTRDNGKWGRRNFHRAVQLDFSDDEIDSLITDSLKLPELYPNECLDNTQVHTHGGYSPTRANGSSVICRSLSFMIGGRHENGFHIRKDSLVWSDLSWGLKVMDQVSPHLVEAPWRNKKADPSGCRV